MNPFCLVLLDHQVLQVNVVMLEHLGLKIMKTENPVQLETMALLENLRIVD
jgi:hypothetical protein